VVALVHAARESTNGQITAKVVHRLAEEFGSKPSDLLVAFGPAIRAESYVYDERIYKLVTAEWKPHLKPIGPGQIMVDNIGYNRAQLIASGVLDKHISDPGLDTGQNSEYYSHVRASKAGQPEGRLAAVVALR
ncbi:MAG TPA: laccase domain-containing protein, partial [Candidatus Saccharimonadia bacterium]|nr:laccase domain-containing protein [Candidatus Saccharimonadia bacterium]